MRKLFLRMLTASALLAANTPLPVAAQKAQPGAKPTAKAPASPAAAVPLAALLEHYYDRKSQLFPMFATFGVAQ